MQLEYVDQQTRASIATSAGKLPKNVHCGTRYAVCVMPSMRSQADFIHGKQLTPRRCRQYDKTDFTGECRPYTGCFILMAKYSIFRSSYRGRLPVVEWEIPFCTNTFCSEFAKCKGSSPNQDLEVYFRRNFLLLSQHRFRRMRLQAARQPFALGMAWLCYSSLLSNLGCRCWGAGWLRDQRRFLGWRGRNTPEASCNCLMSHLCMFLVGSRIPLYTPLSVVTRPSVAESLSHRKPSTSPYRSARNKKVTTGVIRRLDVQIEV